MATQRTKHAKAVGKWDRRISERVAGGGRYRTDAEMDAARRAVAATRKLDKAAEKRVAFRQKAAAGAAKEVTVMHPETGRRVPVDTANSMLKSMTDAGKIKKAGAWARNIEQAKRAAGKMAGGAIGKTIGAAGVILPKEEFERGMKKARGALAPHERRTPPSRGA
jgi:hypothetical protein